MTARRPLTRIDGKIKQLPEGDELIGVATAAQGELADTAVQPSDLATELSDYLPLTGGTLSGNLLSTAYIQTNESFVGDYGVGSSGNAWGQTLWGMGPAYHGGDASASYAPGNLYGVAWQRGDAGDAQVNEGIHVYQNGIWKGGVGALGIKTTGTFYGSGAGITGINAANISTGILPNERIYDSGWIGLTLVNSFTNQSGGTSLRVRRVGNTVHITGQIRRAATPAFLMTIATLPVGYRPDVASVGNAVISAGDSPLSANAQGITVNSSGVLSVGIVVNSGVPWSCHVDLHFPV